MSATSVKENNKDRSYATMNAHDFKTMTVDDLLILRDRITETLSSRVAAERRDLEIRLARLQQVDLREPHRLAHGGHIIGMRATVAPKYRNSDNPSETWSGRGRQPRWLQSAVKAGRKVRDFEILEGEAKMKASRARRKSKGR